METILIVDDEESVRQTFAEWLAGTDWSCRVISAADAEGALVLANEHCIDLAILDWNLGAGHDGLRLLEDLYLFNPDAVAILVTGFAHQATPLDAMRMGVRDYLDKNQDLDRNTFLASVQRQLDRIRPAKRERKLHKSLVNFREAVEKVLPLVQSAAALTDPVPLPEAIRGLLQFLSRAVGAHDAVLLVRSYDPNRQPPEICRIYDSLGTAIAGEIVPFARSVAGSVISMQSPCCMNALADEPADRGVELQPFEKGRATLLAVPLEVAPGIQVVIELFDKPAFTPEDQQLAAAGAELGSELLRQALAERQTHQLLLSAVGSALEASESMATSLHAGQAEKQKEVPPVEVLEQLREGLDAARSKPMDPEDTLRLAEAVRVLAVKHGPAAVKHCTRLVQDLRELLDTVTGAGETRS
jgi:DNA-binding NarL/FixJ family response regulator